MKKEKQMRINRPMKQFAIILYFLRRRIPILFLFMIGALDDLLLAYPLITRRYSTINVNPMSIYTRMNALVERGSLPL